MYIYLYIYIYIYIYRKDITLTRNRVIRYCTQNTNSATYMNCCLGYMCCL